MLAYLIGMLGICHVRSWYAVIFLIRWSENKDLYMLKTFGVWEHTRNTLGICCDTLAIHTLDVPDIYISHKFHQYIRSEALKKMSVMENK